MTPESNAKFKEKLICDFKYDMSKLLIFYPNTQKCENVFSMGFFQRMQDLGYKSTEDLCVITLKGDAKFKEKLTDGLKIT